MSNRAKEIAAIMATYEPGQCWQYRNKSHPENRWQSYLTNSPEPGWDWTSYEYRRKPEPPAPKYRPWTPEEGVGKVIRHKRDTHWCALIVLFAAQFRLGNGVSLDADDLLQNFTQLDGSPCGVLETPTTN